MRKYIPFVLAFVIGLICLNHKVIAQNFQNLYARQIQFEYNGAGLLLTPGARLGSGQSTVTIPDGTGTIDTSYNNFNFLLTSLKAIDAAHGSHSGINWTSFGV